MMSTQLRTILLATDGSADAQDAERAALDLCRHTGAALHLVHSWLYTPVGYDAYGGMMSADVYQFYEEGAKAVLDASAARITAAGGTLTGQHLPCGRTVDAIVETAQKVGADLVLIGSRGLGPIRRLVLGSVSEGVIHGVSCPVLVMRGGPVAWPPARIIVGDDGSDDATAAIGMAATLADATGAQLTLARAFPLESGVPHLEPTQRDELLAVIKGELHTRADQVLDEGADKVQVAAAIDDPAALLLQVAESAPESALIAVGSRGLRLLERLRLGSVSTKVLHAAHGPVLVVPYHPA